MSSSTASTPSAAAAGIIALGDLTVNRLGYGAMRLTGPGIWGPPTHPKQALGVLRRAVELGVNFIDTADSYGPYISENLIAEALYPYPSGLVIATKGGWERFGPGKWTHNASPRHLEQAVHGSLTRLRVDCIDVYQLHVPDPAVSLEASVETLVRLQQNGKIRHIGLSNISLDQLERARKLTPIVSVQNRYSYADREWDYLLDHCEQNNIAFIPWAPLGQAQTINGILGRTAKQLNVSPLQVSLAWLLRRSKATLPIPGTSSIEHLEENIATASLQLPDDAFEEMTSVHPPPHSLRA